MQNYINPTPPRPGDVVMVGDDLGHYLGLWNHAQPNVAAVLLRTDLMGHRGSLFTFLNTTTLQRCLVAVVHRDGANGSIVAVRGEFVQRVNEPEVARLYIPRLVVGDIARVALGYGRGLLVIVVGLQSDMLAQVQAVGHREPTFRVCLYRLRRVNGTPCKHAGRHGPEPSTPAAGCKRVRVAAMPASSYKRVRVAAVGA